MIESKPRRAQNRRARLLTSLALTLFSAVSGGAVAAQRTEPADYRGSNYLPGSGLAMDNALALLSLRAGGTFNRAQVTAEIKQFAKGGHRVLRVFPSFYGWLVDQADYMSNLDFLAGECARFGIRITYVMWSTTSNLFFPLHDFVQTGLAPGDPGLLSTVQLVSMSYSSTVSPVPLPVVQHEFREPWQYVLYDEPGNRLFEAPFNGVLSSWPNGLGAKCIAYIDAVGAFFATQPNGQSAYAGYDLFNESDCCGQPMSNFVELYRVTFSRLRRQHLLANGAPPPRFTAGWANYNNIAQNDDFLRSIGVQQDYLSYHCYEPVPLFAQVADLNLAVGRSRGMQVVCSEFYDRNRPGHLGSLGAYVDVLGQRGIGANMWGFLSANLVIRLPRDPNVFVRVDGMFIPRLAPLGSLNATVDFDLAMNTAPDWQALRQRWRR